MNAGVRLSALATCVMFAAGCGHWRDHGVIDAGRGLVPPETSETYWSDNEGRYAFLSGDYRVDVYFDDGDQLVPEQVVDAFATHAGEQGWVEQLRCERPGAWIVYYTRGKLKVRVQVWKPPVDEDNSMIVQRIGDGNPWPPDTCDGA